jgi:DNA invertase Pin-like site-specific DNA recombinase
MRLAAYLRVSTEAQTEGLGLEVQAEKIGAWAREHHHRLTATYTDAGISGSNGLDTRTALANALAALRRGDADGLVVYRLDRLARDLIVQEQILADLRRMDAAVYSTSPAEGQYLTDDPADPSRKLIRQVLGAVAEYERAMIGLRLKAGRSRKSENGGFAFGAPPFGQRTEAGTLVTDSAEQVTLALIRQRAQAGDSLREIATRLERDGHRPRRGTRWHPNVVRRILVRDRDTRSM